MKRMIQTCTRKIEFDAGHRVWNHESKCIHPHGHRYQVEITATADFLDDLGRIIDFGVLKQRIGGWIDEQWDHGFLVYERDSEMLAALAHVEKSKVYVMPTNPTAENIAQYLLETICPAKLNDTKVTVTKIVVRETPNCSAEAKHV